MDANEHHVYLYLAERADGDGTCFPSLETICEATRLSECTVRRAINGMEKGGYLTVFRGNGRGHRSSFQLLKRVSDRKPSTSPQRVSGGSVKGISQTDKGYQVAKSPTPPNKSNRQLTVKEPSAGANGEFMAAGHLWQELGIAAGPYDVQMLAQVIGFVARDGKIETEAATRGLLLSAQQAIERGEIVNTFWFKDRKFAQEDSRGKSKPSPAKQRLDANRTALAEAAIKRGWFTPDSAVGEGAAALAEPGHSGIDGRVSGGLRTAGAEILPPENRGRT